MAVPALTPRNTPPRSLPLREARTRLSQLVAMAELTDTVTVVTRDGDSRPIAAIVPADAARSAAQARADAGRLAEVTAGWSRRLEAQREQAGRRHAAELRAMRAALAEVWAVLERRAAPGDAELARLRAGHADLLDG
ncbi:type II toxin-antitoxin system Phd/YefM family antitoxin [Micromonospora fiedleri]|uniref:Type II toxin-antitoxin system Phd/YefM family antitoxin n=1 Tax=Micromonospora fiedleri TaxID=1157498 RepID=A0ABS1UNJ5_9ACTN|nr:MULTISPECIES: type II toxin-antitoxin system Phd/YefM family antitoxin [Micromonospora]MBL6277924.1 type II toxin-antitoxin system Phd/YefM family antitoxin [Micromonospora fiedleri]WSK41040.1 type II toxin-antitoxin system Phd/YefM family antitoxin [Micromonospora maris]